MSVETESGYRAEAHRDEISGGFLETHIRPAIPANVLGREVANEEIEDYLGFGPGGV